MTTYGVAKAVVAVLLVLECLCAVWMVHSALQTDEPYPEWAWRLLASMVILIWMSGVLFVVVTT